MGPSSIDAEIRCLGPSAGGDVKLLEIFMLFIEHQLRLRTDFEFTEAILGLFLKVTCHFRDYLLISIEFLYTKTSFAVVLCSTEPFVACCLGSLSIAVSTSLTLFSYKDTFPPTLSALQHSIFTKYPSFHHMVSLHYVYVSTLWIDFTVVCFLLQLHGPTVAHFPELTTIARRIQTEHSAAWSSIQDLLNQCVCLVSYLKSAVI